MNPVDTQYQELLSAILEHGIEKKDRTGTGTKSIFGYTFRHNMSWGFPLLTTKKVAFKTMATELMWFLKGDTNIKYLVDNNCHIWDGDAYKRYEQWDGSGCLYPEELTKEEFINKIKTDDEFAEEWGELGPIYGKQWRQWQNYNGYHLDKPIDQIANLINELKTNPDSRRLMVNAWNVAELDEMVLPPCHYGFQVYTRELSYEEKKEYTYKYFNNGSSHDLEDFEKFNIPSRAISLSWNQRSVDVFLGLPFNIASYGLLLEIIAKMVNMVPDQLIGNLGDTHLYLNHVEQAKEQIERTSFDLLPTLNINTEFWPTESGECGVGPLNATAVLNSFKDDNFCRCLLEEDLQLLNYQSHPAIKAPLSN
jgi:thymidylate synthase